MRVGASSRYVRNGARVFVSNGPVPRERIALNINLDMVSRSDKREIFIAGTYHTPDLKPPLEIVAKRAPITVLFGHDRPVEGHTNPLARRSDQIAVRVREDGEPPVAPAEHRRLAVDVGGEPSRPAILLLHGFPSSARAFRRLAPDAP